MNREEMTIWWVLSDRNMFPKPILMSYQNHSMKLTALCVCDEIKKTVLQSLEKD